MKGNPLVIASVDGRRRIVIRGYNDNPAWSPDGKQIAFDHEGKDGNTLVVVASVGGTLRTVTRSPSYYRLLTWSPQGQLVAATSRGVCLFRPSGGRARCLVRDGFEFTLSPDGRRFAWIAGRRLKVRRVSGGRTLDITPRGPGTSIRLPGPPTGAGSLS